MRCATSMCKLLLLLLSLLRLLKAAALLLLLLLLGVRLVRCCVVLLLLLWRHLLLLLSGCCLACYSSPRLLLHVSVLPWPIAGHGILRPIHHCWWIPWGIHSIRSILHPLIYHSHRHRHLSLLHCILLLRVPARPRCCCNACRIHAASLSSSNLAGVAAHLSCRTACGRIPAAAPTARSAPVAPLAVHMSALAGVLRSAPMTPVSAAAVIAATLPVAATTVIGMVHVRPSCRSGRVWC